ncbi:MAG: hypothetical protein GY765_42115 [bacterium]|nr:hypothetical protein [bacterium]
MEWNSNFFYDEINYVVAEFFALMFVLLVLWLFFHGLVYSVRAFNFRRSMKVFYRGVCRMSSDEGLPEFISTHFAKGKLQYFGDFFLRLHEIFKEYRVVPDRTIFRESLHELRAGIRSYFVNGNTWVFSMHLTIVGVYFIWNTVVNSFHVTLPELLGTVLLFILSYGLYRLREGSADRAMAEFDNLETLYAKQLVPAGN